MANKIYLEDVTASNWEEVVELELSDEQEDFVADNVYSLAESKFNPHAVPKAIYAGKQLVGFLMYESLDKAGRPHEYSIYRLMIDENYQRKGYGRAALAEALSLIRTDDPDWRRITICYVPKNPVARDFYASFGFVEVGLDEHGEMVAEIVSTD